MPSPFPGMDPYLESPDCFGDVHLSMIVRIQSLLNPLLRTKYMARTKIREYKEVENPRFDPIEEAYLTVVNCKSKAVIGVLEVVSPANKEVGSKGRTSFMANRREVLGSAAHWIEIDLLRTGTRSSATRLPHSDYRILVAPGGQRNARYWPISLRERLPVIGIPLVDEDADIAVDLQAVIDDVYDSGSYDLSIDYDKPPDPPLDPDDAKWANKLLRAKGLR